MPKTLPTLTKPTLTNPPTIESLLPLEILHWAELIQDLHAQLQRERVKRRQVDYAKTVFRQNLKQAGRILTLERQLKRRDTLIRQLRDYQE